MSVGATEREYPRTHSPTSTRTNAAAQATPTTVLLQWFVLTTSRSQAFCANQTLIVFLPPDPP